MKKSELFFSALQVPVDFVMILLAGFSAFFVRTSQEILELRPMLYTFSPRQYFQILLGAAVVFVIIYAIDGLYNIRATKRTLKEVYDR